MSPLKKITAKKKLFTVKLKRKRMVPFMRGCHGKIKMLQRKKKKKLQILLQYLCVCVYCNNVYTTYICMSMHVQKYFKEDVNVDKIKREM